ncbi:hypothetical protein [Planomonospora venezuelensis]|uniref:Uncharacterized protein n=1 Tax=Planomonospora venezuelensis TaxID=1999 RepID=A0A841CUX9_PLAVE|nr:hypothetical protein [Planomonospora venezuelensis]MBB5961150.1 hypothetical protein [Planomonospora venezuelensis]GIM99820.1 hypothetical protein Pve01_14790 [Planomonospora venezuelensis]
MSPRNPRNDPYRPLGGAGPLQRPALLVRLWRWRTEIVLAAVVAAVAVLAAAALREGDWWPFLALTSTVSVPAASRSGRDRVRSRLNCLTSRHRIQRVCLETSMHTRTGRIPLILRISPTAAGERAVIMLRAGICASDVRAHAEEIAAACFARRAVVTRHPRWPNTVVVEIVRRGATTPDGLSADFERLYLEAGMTAPRGQDPPDDRHLPRAA